MEIPHLPLKYAYGKSIALNRIAWIVITFNLTLFNKSLAQRDWLTGWRDATVAIGFVDTANAISSTTREQILLPDGKIKRIPYFRIVGTGVLCAHPDTNIKTPILLTAKHVFYDAKKKWNPSSLQIRFSWFSDRSVSKYLGIYINLKTFRGNPLWFSHPDTSVDLAMLPLVISIQDAGRSVVPTVSINDFANIDDTFEGASVLILGYPAAVGNDYWTKPLIRHGVISHVDETNFGKTPFLIDAMIFPGNSGGPVFIMPSGMNKTGSFQVGGKFAFLGIVSAAARQGLVVEKTAQDFELAKDDSTESHLKSFDYMGIGIIEPSNRVKELIDSIVH